MRSKLVAFNEAGEVLGEIDTGHGSVFDEINGAPIVLINALGFDAEGNVYVADTAFGADQFDPPFAGKGGLWMIPHGSLDALADGQDPAEAPVFLEVPGFPDGVEVSPTNGKIHVNTVGPVAGAPDPANGGAMLNTQIRGDIPAKLTVNCEGQSATTLALHPGGSASDLTGPADIAIRRNADGAQLVVVPELFARDATAGDDEVTVLALPADFDAACTQ